MTIKTQTINPYIQHDNSPASRNLNARFMDFTAETELTLTMHLGENEIWMEPMYPIVGLEVPIQLGFDNAAGLEEICLFNFRITKDVTPYDAWITGVPAPLDTSKFIFQRAPIPAISSDLVLPSVLLDDIDALLPSNDTTHPDYDPYAFTWVKFDVLARAGTKWFLADPRVGVKRGG